MEPDTEVEVEWATLGRPLKVVVDAFDVAAEVRPTDEVIQMDRRPPAVPGKASNLGSIPDEGGAEATEVRDKDEDASVRPLELSSDELPSLDECLL